MTTYVTMYDALEGSAIPFNAAVACWYPYDSRSTRPNVSAGTIVLTIDNRGDHPDCDILDLEVGAAWPPSVVTGWLESHWTARHTVGTVYCNRGDHSQVSTPAVDYFWWGADWTGSPFDLSGAVATQYEDAGPYDLSLASTTWLEAIRPGSVTKVPGAVAGLRVTAVTPTAVTVAWSATPKATSYAVAYAQGSAWHGSVPATQTSLTFTGLTTGLAYTFEVSAEPSTSGHSSVTATPGVPLPVGPTEQPAVVYTGATLRWTGGTAPFSVSVWEYASHAIDFTATGLTAPVARAQPLNAGKYAWQVTDAHGLKSNITLFTVA